MLWVRVVESMMEGFVIVEVVELFGKCSNVRSEEGKWSEGLSF